MHIVRVISDEISGISEVAEDIWGSRRSRVKVEGCTYSEVRRVIETNSKGPLTIIVTDFGQPSCKTDIYDIESLAKEFHDVRFVLLQLASRRYTDNIPSIAQSNAIKAAYQARMAKLGYEEAVAKSSAPHAVPRSPVPVLCRLADGLEFLSIGAAKRGNAYDAGYIDAMLADACALIDEHRTSGGDE